LAKSIAFSMLARRSFLQILSYANFAKGLRLITRYNKRKADYISACQDSGFGRSTKHQEKYPLT
jgi:hypothetical protein